MTLDTLSVFDAIENDNTDHRVASRRALALAHNRVESHLGRFLRGAQSEEEFLERLALVQDDFDGFIATASSEVGHDRPEHIAAALKDHYRLAAGVKFEETPRDKEEEEEDEAKESSTKTALIGTPPHQRQPQLPAPPQGGQPPLVNPPVPPALQQQQQQQQQPLVPPIPPQPDQEERGTFASTGASGWRVASPLAEPSADPWSAAGQHDITNACPQCGVEGFNGSRCSHCGYAPQSVAPPTQTPYQDPYRDVIGDPMYETWGPHTAAGENPEYRVMDPSMPDARDYGVVTEGDAFDAGFGGNLGQCPDCGGEIRDNPDPKRTYYPDAFPPYACANCRKTFTPIELEMVHSGTYPGRQAAATNPAEQNDDSSRLVTCPECGGDGKTANKGKCAKCSGKGKVPNFGDSMIDALSKSATGLQQNFDPNAGSAGAYDSPPASGGGTGYGLCPECHSPLAGGDCPNCGWYPGASQRTGLPWIDRGPGGMDNPYRQASDGNTDLGGPEPVMNKSQGPGSKPDVPGKIVEKDIVEPIKATNEGELTEIGDIEHQTLPTQTGDTPFATGGEDSGPHTDTFGGSGQADPVTNVALSAYNPLADMLESPWPSNQVVQQSFLARGSI